MAGLVPDRGRGDWPRRGFAIPCRLACRLSVKPGNSAAERAGNRKRHHQDRLLAIRTVRGPVAVDPKLPIRPSHARAGYLRCGRPRPGSCTRGPAVWTACADASRNQAPVAEPGAARSRSMNLPAPARISTNNMTLPGRAGLSRRARSLPLLRRVMAVVSSPVITSGCCSGPRRLIESAVGECRQDAGAFDAEL